MELVSSTGESGAITLRRPGGLPLTISGLSGPPIGQSDPILAGAVVMLQLSPAHRVFVAVEPVDFRKQAVLAQQNHEFQQVFGDVVVQRRAGHA